MHKSTAVLVCGVALLASWAASGGQKTLGDGGWEASAAKAGLSAEDVRQLAGNKLLMTNEAYRQVFTPYLSRRLPVFVTSDSLLNAFHVLYEESVRRLEKANARKLPEILRFVWKNLSALDVRVEGRRGLGAAAKARAQVVVGTALKLLRDDATKPDAKIAALIDAEVGRIVAAKAVEKPAWLGPPDRGFMALDYSRYRPRGFYTNSEGLQRYFRAVAWLQSIPFRVSKDEELLAILMLGHCVSDDRFGRDFARMMDYSGFFRCFDAFVGPADNWNVRKAARKAWGLDGQLTAQWLPERRETLLEEATGRRGGPQISDQLRFAPDDPAKTAEPHFRVLSAHRTPDAVLFHRTTDLRHFQRPFPTGLEVLAVLGSSYARAKLTYGDRAKLLKTLDEAKTLFKGSSLYLDYLNCLAALLDEPEPDAPAFIKGEPWAIKSCQTALAGWAQLRHTWALQAKQSAHYLCKMGTPTGFVEPEPEFFARMASLVEHTEGLLRKAGALEPDTEGLVADIRYTLAILDKRDVAKHGMKALRTLTREELMRMHPTLMLAMALATRRKGSDPSRMLLEAAPKLEALADRLEKGELPTQPLVKRFIKEAHIQIEPLWRRLSSLSRRLETLAHKQLRRAPFTRDEEAFLGQYGEQLAGVMLYGGNSYVTPRDDAPRVVDVYAGLPGSGYLEVGIARARALYVLYPWEGRQVLCRGAVLPYCEFRSPTRLTDRQWKTLLDSPKRPDVPAWLKPIVASKGIRAPELEPEGPPE